MQIKIYSQFALPGYFATNATLQNAVEREEARFSSGLLPLPRNFVGVMRGKRFSPAQFFTDARWCRYSTEALPPQ
jgi:hypothetical protein